ncbi:MAG: 3-dehydroquinate synthase [Polyangiaceae bacterium]|nr:3-dehydroquinate synthase [Polyangiaceae bacterium]
MVHPAVQCPRPVYLTGFMGTGKSTVGPLLARSLDVPFVDTDALLEARFDAPLPSLLSRGEASFRSLERTVLEEQLADPSPRVVALGGGALLDRTVRLRLLARNTLCCLTASPDQLRARLQHDSSRPLLAGAPWALESLLQQRTEGYAEAHVLLPTDHQTPDQLAALLLGELARADLLVAAGSRSYPVRVEKDLCTIPTTLQHLEPTSILLVTDRNVAQHHEARWSGWLQGFPWEAMVLEPGESQKSPAVLLRLWERLQQVGMDRRGVVLAVGGGVVTDLGGLAAGTWLRGVRWVAVPSSLLGMVDAAIGGKTAVDLGAGKNVIGAFHQPSAVHMPVTLLHTEPERSFRSGLAEVIKTALVGDAGLLRLLEEEHEAVLRREPGVMARVVRASAAVKAGVVSRDEKEQGERRLLNLGHTVGHALEALGGYERWTHGEAVALGMGVALRLGERWKITEHGLAERVERLLALLGLPWRVDPGELKAMLPLLQHDKKREQGSLHYVLVKHPGEALTQKVAVRELAAALGAEG